MGLLPGVASAEPHSQVPRLGSILGGALGFVAQIWAKIGCTIDPSGLCVPSPGVETTQEGEIGCELDPHGHCIQSPTAQGTPENQGEIGCTIDPNGHCTQSPTAQGTVTQGEIGCGLDPDGLCVR
jgi:hypothetical protein